MCVEIKCVCVLVCSLGMGTDVGVLIVYSGIFFVFLQMEQHAWRGRGGISSAG